MTHPSAAQQAAFLRDLAAVSPRLVRDKERAVRHGRDICLTLAESHKVAVKNTAKREGVDSGVAEQMVAVAKRNFCP